MPVEERAENKEEQDHTDGTKQRPTGKTRPRYVQNVELPGCNAPGLRRNVAKKKNGETTGKKKNRQ